MKVKILQVNLGRSRAAHDILCATMCEKQIDLAIISEPNIKASENNGYIMDRKKNVAIYIRNKNIGVHSHSSGDGYVCLKWGTWCIYGCYCSPNITLEVFGIFTDSLLQDIKASNVDVVVAGDFNAKAAMWGSPITDRRGEHLMEWAAELNLSPINTGDVPTFERGGSKSFIDITWASENLTKYVKNWEVLPEEVLTYHHYIYFEVEWGSGSNSREKSARYILDKSKFVQKLEEHFTRVGEDGEWRPKSFISTFKKISRECTILFPREGRAMPYWWDSDINNKRQECNRLRRKCTRTNRNQGTSQLSVKVDYKQAKKELSNMILKAKRRHWKNLQQDLEKDIWGDGYKIVMRHVGGLVPPYNPPVEQKIEILKHLFPTRDDNFTKSGRRAKDVHPFTAEELSNAVSNMKLGRAPGPDFLTSEAIKIAAGVIPAVLLATLNQLLKNQSFPAHWKEATVVLLGKGKAVDPLRAFRPICLLSTMGKLYERMIKARLEEELEKKGGLSERQFGFRKGRSTINAIKMVVDRVVNSKKRWVVVVALDIKNAFNSASWSRILKELKRRNIPLYLRNITEDYFTDRCIIINKTTKMAVNAGVPQGSVLGPTLWNVLYDGVLNLDWMEGVTALAYADDLAIVVEAEDKREVIFKTNETLEQISKWMGKNQLEIAPEKTKAAVLKGPRKWDFDFQLLGNRIVPKHELKYLGVVLNYKLTFTDHVKYITGKVEATQAALMKILPNIGGPGSKRREILYTVVQSQSLYAIPAWISALRIKKLREILERLQRRSLLRITSGYRTISTRAIQVLAGIPPIYLVAEEQSRVFNARSNNRTQDRNKERKHTLRMWQNLWRQTEAKAEWTRILIPDLVPWVECKFRCMDYYLTQFLSGHGNFRTYLKRFKLADEDKCLDCGDTDTPEHAMLVCQRWEVDRCELSRRLGQEVKKSTIVKTMLESKTKWDAVRSFTAKVLSTREREERDRQRRNNTSTGIASEEQTVQSV